MSRIISALTLGCLTAIGITTYSMLYGGETERIAVPPGNTSVSGEGGSGDGDRNGAPATTGSPGTDAAAAELTEARRSHSIARLGQVLDSLRERVARDPDDNAGWRLLADALLQRVALRGHLLGMQPGRPVYGELPEDITADLDAADAAIERARQLGDDSGELHRIAAEIMSQRITGLSAALKWNGKIEEAIAKAAERAADDPRLHLVLGVRKLMAPRFFGQDIEKALEHFQYAAEAMPDDERPAMFAGMASYLARKRLQAIEWLERAVERNPNNVFARVVLERVRRGEDNPFGRNVSATEASSGK